MKKLGRIALAALDVLLAVTLLFIIANLANARLIYRARDGFLDYLCLPFAALGRLRLAAAFPWGRFVSAWSIRQKLVSLALLALAVAGARIAIGTSLRDFVRYFTVTRMAVHADNDQDRFDFFFNFRRWYAQDAFVDKVKSEVPEDAAFAYFNDLRAHMLSYQLYPRRIYVLPELQAVLDANEQTRWIDIKDPLMPEDPRFRGEAVGYEKPGALDRLAKMIENNKIEWMIRYDAVKTSETMFCRLPPPLEGAP